jgi:hypothetical protein
MPSSGLLRRVAIFLRSILQLPVTVNVIPSSMILFFLMMWAIRTSETSVLTRATRRHMPEDIILHCHTNVCFVYGEDMAFRVK